MSRKLSAIILAGVILTGCSSPADTEVTSDPGCAAPLLTLKNRTVPAGEVVIVTGTRFFDGCRDTSEFGAGKLLPSEPLEPLSDLTVLWVQGDNAQELTTVDAAADGTWTSEVRIPAGAGGSGVIRVEPADDVVVTIAE